MKILITGAEGFTGYHLIRLLLARGATPETITGTYLNDPGENSATLAINWVQADVADQCFSETLDRISPDQIYHLAGQASIGYSFQEPEETLRSNVDGVLILFKWMRSRRDHAPKALIISSSEIYEDIGTTPRTELSPLASINFYTLSKMCTDRLASLYHEYFNLNVVRIRAFNHIGPGQNPRFALPNFAKQIAALEKQGMDGSINTGDLTIWRDFTDVRDTVRAYQLIMEHGKAGDVYNVCSGTMYRLQDLLRMLIEKATVKVKTLTTASNLRKNEVMHVIGDYSKLHALTGWRPEIEMQTTLADILEYWRQRT